MRIAKQPQGPIHRRYRIVGLLALAAVALAVILALVAQLTQPRSGGAAPATTLSREPEKSTVSTRGIESRVEIEARLREIFEVRDRAIRTREPRLLENIYAVDCPCLKGDRQLIQELIAEQLVWRGVKVSVDVRNTEQVNDRLWSISAVVTTSAFVIETESGDTVRRIPQGQEYSRFSLTRPAGLDVWLLGQASVIEERG